MAAPVAEVPAWVVPQVVALVGEVAVGARERVLDPAVVVVVVPPSLPVERASLVAVAFAPVADLIVAAVVPATV